MSLGDVRVVATAGAAVVAAVVVAVAVATATTTGRGGDRAYRDGKDYGKERNGKVR